MMPPDLLEMVERHEADMSDNVIPLRKPATYTLTITDTRDGQFSYAVETVGVSDSGFLLHAIERIAQDLFHNQQR